MAPWKAEKANEEVSYLLSLDLMEPPISYSPWAWVIVIVKKKGNQMRVCCDFRFLNGKPFPDVTPRPELNRVSPDFDFVMQTP